MTIVWKHAGVWDVQSGGIVAQHALFCFVFAWQHVLMRSYLHICICAQGYGDASYEGLYLTDADIREMTPTMVGVPVKIEHRGVDVGRVVSAWIHEVFAEPPFLLGMLDDALHSRVLGTA